MRHTISKWQVLDASLKEGGATMERVCVYRKLHPAVSRQMSHCYFLVALLTRLQSPSCMSLISRTLVTDGICGVSRFRLNLSIWQHAEQEKGPGLFPKRPRLPQHHAPVRKGEPGSRSQSKCKEKAFQEEICAEINRIAARIVKN
jgi:hypothetical protein